MQVSFKAEGENKDKQVPNEEVQVLQETEEEKGKRMRKEASKRMQQKFRERLHARTSGIIEQINAKPEKASKDHTASTQQGHVLHPSQGNTANDRVASIGTRTEERTTQNHNQAGRQQR